MNEVLEADARRTVANMLSELQDGQNLHAGVSGGASLQSATAPLLDPKQIERAAEALGIQSLPTPKVELARLGPWNASINFSGGVPVGGWANLTIFSDGSYNFSGHFHDSGAPSYDTALVWGVKSGAGTIYTFSHQGRTHGTFEPGSRDDDWNISGSNPALAAGWNDLWASWTYRWEAKVNFDIGGILDEIKNILGVAGAVIAIV